MAKVPRSAPVGENSWMVLLPSLATKRSPLPLKARAMGPFKPVEAKVPRSAPVGENSWMVLFPAFATKRFCARAIWGADNRVKSAARAIQRRQRSTAGDAEYSQA